MPADSACNRSRKTYYAKPPHMPSTQTNKNTKNTLRLSDSSLKKPTADSYASATRIPNWMIAGAGKKCSGKAGIPNEIEERDRKTVI